MRDEVDDALLHERLRAGALEVSPSNEESRNELRAMIARAEEEAQVKPRRLGLIISGSLMAALLLGGATIPGIINPFREASQMTVPDPLFDYEYTLPSGINCTAVYGVFTDADPTAVDIIRRGDGISPLVDDSDVAPVIADMRAHPETVVTASGTREPGGYGTKYYDEDSEYADAVWQVMEDRLQVELYRQGLSGDALSVNRWGEQTCPGKE